jgi:hypothetical protein
MMRGTVWLVAAMLGLGAGLAPTAGGAPGPQQAGNTQSAAPAKAADDKAAEDKDWGEPSDEPVQAGENPPAPAPAPTEDAPAAEPAKAPVVTPAAEPAPPAPPPPAPEKAASAPVTEPEPARKPALALPAATPEQQQLEKDTAQLLRLVQELKVEVEKAGKDTLSLVAVRKADEIQRLARNLKERMREHEQVPGNKP